MALNLLVIDDSAVMRRMIIRTLKVGGLPIKNVHEAGDGSEALEKLSSHAVDLALLDLNMPGMNGMTTLAHIREDPKTKKLPVVVVSTEGSETRIQEIRDQGAMFLRKPFAPEALVAAIADAIGGVDDDEFE